MSEFPERLELESAGRRTVYVLRPDLYALHEWNGSGSPVHAVPQARVAAFEGPPAGKMPVYANGTLLAYPTGTIWVRFQDGIDASSRAADLERLGFRIDASPAYARNGAYLVADNPAAALSRLDDLRAVEGIEHVEPQMLLEASSR